MSGYTRVSTRWVVPVAILAGAALAAHHAAQVVSEGTTQLQFIFAVAFLWLCLVSLLPHFHRDIQHARNSNAQRRVDRMRVTVIVPVKNEGTAMFRAMLDSLATQTRLPQRIHIVENGTPEPTMLEAFNAWAKQGPPGVELWFDHTPTPGKRNAQAIAVRSDPRAAVYATIDSDAVLEPDAMERGLAPFADRRVMSVGGMLYGANTRRNLLTRLIELGYTAAFLNARSAFSMLKSVNVQCGALAWVRGSVFRKYLNHYLTMTVAGRHIQNGDDAMLTRYAAMEGYTLFQVGAIAHTLHPERLGHLTRQRIRWARSFYWGNVWALRAISPARIVWWLVAFKLTRTFIVTAALVVVLILVPILTGVAPWFLAVWLTGITYIQTARYLTVRIPGQSFGQQLRIWLMAPIMLPLNLYLGPVMRMAGLLTCLRYKGWTTRQQVEVELSA